MALNIPVWPPPSNPPWPGGAAANPYEAIRFGARGSVPEGFMGGSAPTSAPTRPISTPSLGPAAQPMGELMPGPTPEQAAAQARLDAAARGSSGGGSRVFSAPPTRGVQPGGRVVTRGGAPAVQTPVSRIPTPGQTAPGPLGFGTSTPGMGYNAGPSMPGTRIAGGAGSIGGPSGVGPVYGPSIPGGASSATAATARNITPLGAARAQAPNAGWFGAQGGRANVIPGGARVNNWASRVTPGSLGRGFVTRGLLPQVGGAGIEIGMNELGFDPNVSAASGQGAAFAGMAGGLSYMPAGAVGAGLGEVGGRGITGATSGYFNDPISEDIGMSRADVIEAGRDNITMAYDGPGAGALDWFVNDSPAAWMADNVMSGQRGLGDIPLVGGLFGGGDQGPSEEEMAQAQQAQARLEASRPENMRSTLIDLGLPPGVADTALEEAQQSLAYQQELRDRGMGPMVYEGMFVERDPETGQFMDPTSGDAIDPSKVTPPSDEDLRVMAMDNLLMAVPELQAQEQMRQEQFNRAAAYQAVIGQYLDPYLNRTREISDLYAASGQPAMAAANLEMMNAQEGVIRQIPQIQAAEEQMAQQAQLEQMLFQLQMDELRAQAKGEDDTSDEEDIIENA